MGCSSCGGKRAGIKYQVYTASGQPDGAPKATIGEAQQAVRGVAGASFKAVKA